MQEATEEASQRQGRFPQWHPLVLFVERKEDPTQFSWPLLHDQTPSVSPTATRGAVRTRNMYRSISTF